ncbi:glycosyl hydrolase family 18 protein [Paenibacillus pini]
MNGKNVIKGHFKRGFLSLFMVASLVISLITSFSIPAGHVSAAESIQAVAACTDAAWDATKTYNGGNRVSLNGKVYEAKWWTLNENPAQSGSWGAWKYISDCGGTTPGDTTAPTAPANLTSTAKTANTVSLSWSASTDNVAVTGYNVYSGSTLNTTVTGTTATVSGLTASTAYTFTVKAKDAAGNLSAASNVLSVTTSDTSTPNPGTTPNKVIGGYVADWNFPNVNTIPATKLTHLYYAFANAANNAVSGGDTGKIAQLVSLKQKNPSLKVLISVGGWGNSANFSGIASTDANRTAFANSALQYIRANKLDGIDIDWEYPAVSDKQNYTLFIKKIREVLDAGSVADGRSNNKYQVTAATGASQYGIEGIDLASVQQYFDYINIMTYDMQVGTNSHHTNLYTSSLNSSYSVDNAVKLYKNSGVATSKIVIGGAFYSAGTTTEYTYDQLLASYINKNGWTRQWDDVAKAPYLTNGTGFISYDDEQSLTEKVKYLKSQGLAGIMFWEYGQNTGGQLLNAIYTAVQQP